MTPPDYPFPKPLSAGSARAKLAPWLFAAGLLAAVFLAYQPAWNGRQVWDDPAHLTRSDLQPCEGLWHIWFDLGATAQYYPLLHSAFWLEHQLWGDAMLRYHLVNILLHGVAALLVARVLRRLEVPGAYLAAAIFALHPVHVETVAWITELKNTLSAVFYLSAMLAYLRFDRTRARASYAAAFALFGLGLLSKTVVATLPASLLLIFWWQRGRLSWKRDIWPLLPWLIVGAAAGLFTAWVERKLVGAEGSEFDLSLVERCLLAGRIVWFYLAKLFWPSELIFSYPRWAISQTVWWQYLLPAAVLIVLAWLWRLRRLWRAPLAAMLFFIGTLFPVLGFFNVYPFRYSYVADHFQYLASLGVIALVSAGIALLLGQRWSAGVSPAFLRRQGVEETRSGGDFGDLGSTDFGKLGRAVEEKRSFHSLSPCLPLSRSPCLSEAGGTPALRMAGYIACLALLSGLAVLTWRQSRMYADNETLFKTTIQRNPQSWMAYHNLAVIYDEGGQMDKAIVKYQESLAIHDDNPEAHNNYGAALARRGETDEAMRHYRKAIELFPRYSRAYNNLGAILAGQGQFDQAIDCYKKAVDIEPTLLQPRHNLAIALAATGQYDGAVVQLRRCLKIKSDYAPAHSNLGAVLVAQGKLEEAVGEFQKSLQITPQDAPTHHALGAALDQQGRTREAIAAWREANRLQPDQLTTLNRLAWALATSSDSSLRDGKEAMKLAERAVELSAGRDAFALDTLAAARAEAGRFDEAVEAAQRAISVASIEGETALADSIRARLSLYQSAQPFRDSR